jgi:hypothetical protein
MKASILFAQFYMDAPRHVWPARWVDRMVAQCKTDPRIEGVFRRDWNDTPIHMMRNDCFCFAEERCIDIVVMIDDDMTPDLYCSAEQIIQAQYGIDPTARPFLGVALEQIFKAPAPGAIVLAPYCGPPPIENVFAFRVANWASDDPDAVKRIRLEQYAREEAAQRGGIEEVIAGGTGLCAIDMRGIHLLDHPRFDYEWTDKTMRKKGSTEDVVFFRNISLVGVPVYMAWDSWAGHNKNKCVGKPKLSTVDDVRENLRRALANGNRNSKLVMIGDGDTNEPTRQARIEQALGTHQEN